MGNLCDSNSTDNPKSVLKPPSHGLRYVRGPQKMPMNTFEDSPIRSKTPSKRQRRHGKSVTFNNFTRDSLDGV